MTESSAAYTLDLFEDSPPAVVSQVPGGYRALALAELNRHPGEYDPEFVSWLKRNWPAWTAFCKAADRARERGRSNYSARGIFQWLRWETDLRESPVIDGRTPTFKINNRWSRHFSRLYNAMTPDRAGFFYTREAA